MKKFPTGRFGRQRLEFFPAPDRAPLRAFAALVFPWREEQVLICNIEDRGWCIPSGRVEPEETSCEAAEREAQEEAGALLQDLQYLGCYRVTERNEIRWVDVFVAHVVGLVEIGVPEESLGRQFVQMDDLPGIYHLWNDLTREVFLYSKQVLDRHREALGGLSGTGVERAC